MKVVFVLFLFTSAPALAQGFTMEPAPEGEPAMVAQQIISRDFDTGVCALVVDARRFGDGSIRAACSNGETFRVFSLSGKTFAMRCAAARAAGIDGC